MKKFQIIILIVSLLFINKTVFGFELTPQEILKKVAVTYNTLQIYKAEGTIKDFINNGDTTTLSETSFSVLLKKPNMYLISWKHRIKAMPVLNSSGAVWSDGNQPYLFRGSKSKNTYSKMTNDQFALAGAGGLSSGASLTIPMLFLPTFKQQSLPFSRFNNPLLKKNELIGDEECYVISSSIAISKEETVWISKTSFLIKKHTRSFEQPDGSIAKPKLSDNEIEEAIIGMGHKVTDESKAKLKDIMSKVRSTALKPIKGTHTENYTNITFPELNESDFNFVLPEGTIQNDLFKSIITNKQMQ